MPHEDFLGLDRMIFVHVPANIERKSKPSCQELTVENSESHDQAQQVEQFKTSKAVFFLSQKAKNINSSGQSCSPMNEVIELRTSMKKLTKLVH